MKLSNYIIQTEAQQCKLCNEVFLRTSEATKHVKKCLTDQRRIDREWRRAKQRDRIQNAVRLEATTLEHAIQLLRQHAWKNFGLRVTFESYPDSLGNVSNTHESPIGLPTNWDGKKGKPKAYLGFLGRWKGKIRGKCKHKEHEEHEGTDLECIFKEDFGHGFNGFHSGTGCPGAEFDIDGCIFVDDFPKWKEPKGILSMMKEIYSDKLDNFQVVRAIKRIQKNMKRGRGTDIGDLTFQTLGGSGIEC